MRRERRVRLFCNPLLLSVLFTVICITNAQAQQVDPPQTLHGTVNIVLANANGMVVLTDSMLTDQNGNQLPQPGQKLFVLDNKSVCTVAGLIEGGSPFQELVVNTRSKIYAYAQGLKAAKPLTLQQELDGLVFIFGFAIDTLANTNDFEKTNPANPEAKLNIQLMVAGYDLDGIAKVLKATVFIRHRRFKGYDTSSYYDPVIVVGDQLAHQTAGMSIEVEQILKNPESKDDDPVLRKYGVSLADNKTPALSLAELNELASRLAHYAADAHREVGGNDQVAILRKDQLPEIHAHIFEEPPPSPPIFVFTEMSFTTTSASLPLEERLKAFRPTLTNWRHRINLYIESQVNGFWIPMDSNLFIGNTFEGCTFYYDGGRTQLDQTDQVYDSDLLIGPHADINGPLVRHLLNDFKWLNVGQTDMGLDPPPNWQPSQKVTVAPTPPKSRPPVVVSANFPLYSDRAATQQVPNITGVTLNVPGPGPGKMILELFPTTKLGYYKPGMKVSWEWDDSKIWRYSMWYRDPKTHAIKLAFGGSMAFVGKNIRELQVK